jgi:hypothetical protein
MSRRIACALIALALLGATACADNILKERPVSRAARRAPAQAPSLSGSSTAESSVCAAYRRQLHQAQSGKVLAPTAALREQMRARELTLNAVIADACE